MARYIDASELIRRIKIETNPQLGGTLGSYNRYPLLNLIDNIPTAEVAPKSEEGAECPTCHGTGRIGTTDWLTKNISKKQLAEEKAKAIAEHEQYIKTEYAREIFEEIEKMLKNQEVVTKNPREEDLGNWILHNYIPKKIAELKKKYTEGDCE